jgi:hypothetical protein
LAEFFQEGRAILADCTVNLLEHLDVHAIGIIVRLHKKRRFRLYENAFLTRPLP